MSELQGTPWKAEGAEKRRLVREMFAEIAPVYDRLNGWMSLRRHHRWRALAAESLHLKPGDAVLDLCCGTGDFFAPIRQRIGETGAIVGIDFCPPMLELARSKPGSAHLAAGDACRLPVLGDSFESVSVGWGIRNVPDIDLAHREIYRVLKSGGRFVSLDMAVPRNPVARYFSRLVGEKALPWLGRRFGNQRAYTYLPASTQRFAGREELAESMRRAGFCDVGYRDFFFGNLCLHWGRKP